ncbi:MAG: amidase [Rhodospirillales bacterium 69-11]|nr:amidase [Rhodospirillales bacterium]OJW24063.1 MAG: amidase [Rhodospirillales bacterium 69-11]
MHEDPWRLTVTEAARRIAAGTLHPETLVESCLDRIAAREPEVRAFAWFDPAGVRGAAGRAASGPLRGIPIGVKDVLDTADMPSAYGSPIWRGWQPRADAAPVAWARAAGAVVMGKTVTTEFATRTPGPTTNPVNPAHTPGGSSSGSAAGVAAGFFPVAYGTQTAGSVIRPAAYCGVVGYKPSYALIDRAGMKIMSASLDTVGLLARSIADCALVAGTVSGRDLGDPERRPDRAPRIGVCRSPTWDAADAPTQALLQRVADRLAQAGASVSERALPPLFGHLIEAHPVVMNAESARALGWELATAREEISASLQERLAFGLAQSGATLDAAYETFRETQAAFPSATEGLDVLLTPAAPGEAPAGIGWTGDPALNFIWTSLHVPCVTVPAGTGPNGLPLGIQIVGRRGEDRAVLAWAQWVAAAIG